MATFTEHISAAAQMVNDPDVATELAFQLDALGLGSALPPVMNSKTSMAQRQQSSPTLYNHHNPSQQNQHKQHQQALLNAILGTQQQRPSAGPSPQDILALLELQQAQAAVTQNAHLHAQLALQVQAQQAILAAQTRQNMSSAQQQYLQQLAIAALPTARSPLAQKDPAIRIQDRRSSTKGRHGKADIDTESRTRFESTPVPSPRLPAYATPQMQTLSAFPSAHSPFTRDVSWQSSFSPSAGGGSPAPNAMRTSESPASNLAQNCRPGGAAALSALLSRRTGTEGALPSGEARSPSPPSPSSPVKNNEAIYTNPTAESLSRALLGHGRPGNVQSAERAWTLSAADMANAKSHIDVAPRSASFAGMSVPRTVVVRQPFGPPGAPNELGEKNFQSRIRKQAGRGLGLLSRRGDTPAATPTLA
ncbi:hypothetical protein BD324DRAFT_650829 [Kockovaella imperatae]|uniref:Uncharacterized protein n=1 Tax=Kockovaella imperatae TaxID=4999 RepID=A0A1Y1UGN6_9TREE|nr:hypothetical protein BD324DRAFT_650829 [Kockovaella imperatae]ORX37223.1 hypothetical protein BD324DRAFT_650829 [Kockovaella imperatae]